MKTHYTRSTTLAVAACALGVSIGSSFAGTKPKLNHDAGTIQSVDAVKHEVVITDKSNKTQTFSWNDSTRFRESNKRVSAVDLKRGESVHLRYKAEPGTPLLEEVTIIPAATTAYTPKSK